MLYNYVLNYIAIHLFSFTSILSPDKVNGSPQSTKLGLSQFFYSSKR